MISTQGEHSRHCPVCGEWGLAALVEGLCQGYYAPE